MIKYSIVLYDNKADTYAELPKLSKRKYRLAPGEIDAITPIAKRITFNEVLKSK